MHHPKTPRMAAFQAPTPTNPLTTPPSLIAAKNTKPPSRMDSLSKRHLLLASLPADYSPPPSPPLSAHNLALLRDKILGSGYAWESMRLGSIRRNYRPVPLLRANARVSQANNEYGEWLLPETEDEWFQWEKKIERERETQKKVEEWKAGVGSAPKDEIGGPESFRAHVRGFQDATEHSIFAITIEQGVSPNKEKELRRETSSPADTNKKQNVATTLRFPVVKRSTLPAATFAIKGAHVPPRESTVATSPPLPSPLQDRSPSHQSNGDPRQSKPEHIVDIFDGTYLPPSFPPNLITSTPPPLRTKPPPIRATTSLPLFDFPPSSSTRKPVEPVTPAPGHAERASSPLRVQRVDDVLAGDDMEQAMNVCAQREESKVTPPRSSMATPSGFPFLGPVSAAPQPAAPGLGNAKGLPVPSSPEPGLPQMVMQTPEKKPLPTLTELLASSRRSKQRPRPPSRKKAKGAAAMIDESASNGKGKDKAIPIGEQNVIDSIRDQSSEARSYLSSPASTSGSDQVVPVSPRSPLLPLEGSYMQPPGIFIAEHTSTQVPGNCAGGTGTTGSGFGGVYGYNSQFDVEGQCDQVSELLERDVDFDGWLRDIPVDEET